jgi:hypothetical protein
MTKKKQLRLQQLAQLESASSTSNKSGVHNNKKSNDTHKAPVPIIASKITHDPVSNFDLSEEEKNEIIVIFFIIQMNLYFSY